MIKPNQFYFLNFCAISSRNLYCHISISNHQSGLYNIQSDQDILWIKRFFPFFSHSTIVRSNFKKFLRSLNKIQGPYFSLGSNLPRNVVTQWIFNRSDHGFNLKESTAFPFQRSTPQKRRQVSHLFFI